MGLSYGDYRAMTKAEMTALGLKGRQYQSASDPTDIIPISRFQKLAGSTAPSRQTVAEKLDHTVPTLTHAIERPKVSETLRNRRAYAETYGTSLREASKDKELKYLNKVWKEDLKRLDVMVKARGKSKVQSPAEIELRKSLNITAVSIGRKKADNYTDFGQTDHI